ncbi:MAG TPA: Ig-like domain-containing protein, partial [Candidatus Polarisedimenticolaceae bacterium]|nr:Ig-like domain-containing protein [Candidatus Polarisedimenticolaceae bacterium]
MDRGARVLVGALVLGVAAVSIGCEDTPFTAGEDWTISVEANPSVVTLEDDETPSTSTITATVVNATGVAQSGVSVSFTPAGGTLSPSLVETDGAGRATTTLTIGSSDPDSIKVTATSGAVSGDATVTKSTAESTLPVADIDVTPPTEQVQGGAVVFDGSGSTDEGGGITFYKWTISSNNPDAALPGGVGVFKGAGLTSIGFPGGGRPA